VLTSLPVPETHKTPFQEPV